MNDLRSMFRPMSDAVRLGAGRLSSDLRRRIEARAARYGGAERDDPEEIPEELVELVEKTSLEAWTVVDDDIDRLREKYSEDEIYEVVVCAACGSGVGRWERGMSALYAALERAEAEGES